MSILMDMPPIEGHEYTGEVRILRHNDIYATRDFSACTWTHDYISDHKFAVLRRLRWRAATGGHYYVVGVTAEVSRAMEDGHLIDEKRYKLGNYFQTEEQAALVALLFTGLLASSMEPPVPPAPVRPIERRAGGYYYYVKHGIVEETRDINTDEDRTNFSQGNYYLTDEEARRHVN